jgi:SM-20-related protein
MKPTVIDDFLPAGDYARLRDYVLSQPMAYGSKSNNQTDPHGHWSWKPVHDQRQNLADLTATLPPLPREMWHKVNQKIWELNSAAIVRCYANGYTYGTDGYFHTDSQRADEHTIIIYICKDWLGDWAGETVFWDGHDEYTSVLPRANRAVIAPSNMSHCARAVSRKCNVLRTTFMYKTRPKRSADFERLSAFLVEHGGLKQEHTAGTLHDHLVRVFQLLEDKFKDMKAKELCFAGGLHSIYGTNVYQRQLLKPDAIGRSVVSSYFGQSAEALAFMFSLLDRPATLEKPDLHDSRLKLRYDHMVEVSPQMLRQLQLIECANLADQNSLAKWPNLAKIWSEAK